VWTLYAAAITTGFGIAIMQPGMPTLVREWLPSRIGLATVVYSNGMVVGAILPPVLTIPFVLPLLGGSWRLNFLVWAVPAVLISVVFLLLSPKETHRSGAATAAIGALWWPDWRNPLIWLRPGRIAGPGAGVVERRAASRPGAFVRGRPPLAAARMAVFCCSVRLCWRGFSA
jgi:MFS family permease